MKVSITKTESGFKMEVYNSLNEKVLEQDGKEFTVDSPFGNDFMEFEESSPVDIDGKTV